MTNANFEKALSFVEKWEGGWSDHPNDRGGKTKYGITEKTYRHYFPRKDIREATRAEAALIYHNGYWIAAGCDSLPLPLAVVVFDTAVNSGPGRAKRWLNQTTDVREYVETRRKFYYGIVENDPSQKVFLKGWLNRLNDLRKYADILSAEEMNP